MLGELTEIRSVFNTSSRFSETSFKSKYSTKQRKNILLARLKAQNEINELKLNQTRTRLEFEKLQIQRKHEAEEKHFEIQRIFEEQQIIHQNQLSEAKLRAKLYEIDAKLRSKTKTTNPV